jgi:predicted DCC family thiol-disulfide oxidoreductase YuxK
MAVTHQDILYYDGQCSLCQAEMSRLEQHKRHNLQLVDIHQLTDDKTLPTREQLLENLHLVTAEGETLVGLEANVAAWQKTRYGWLWRILLWPLVYPVAKLAYQWWASRRYRRLYQVPDSS